MNRDKLIEIKHPIVESVFTLYTVGYLVLSILPMVKYSVPYIISGIYCLSFILLYFFKENQSRKRLLGIEAIIFMGLIHGTIFYLTENGGVSQIINEPIRALRIIISCYIFYFISGYSKGTRLVIWLFITVLFLYISIKTLNGLAQDDMLARILASGSDEETLTEYRMQNMGGFEFSYALGLMLPMFILMIFNSKYFIMRLFALFASIYVVYYILTAQYMILFIVGVSSLFLLVIFGSYKPQVKLFTILIPVVFIFIASPLLRWIASFLDSNSIMYSRLINVSEVFTGERDVSETSSRVALYLNALTAFLTNPFFGEFSSTAAAESHSLFFGVAAKSGIIGLTFLIIEFVIYYKTSKTIMQKRGVNIMSFKVAFICYIILGVLNPIGYAYEIAIVIFLYVPLTINLFGNKTSEHYEII